MRQLDYEAVWLLGVTWDHLPNTGTPLLKGPVPLPGELDLLGAPCLHYASVRRDEFGEGFRKGAGLWLLSSGGGTAVVGDFGGAGAQEARRGSDLLTLLVDADMKPAWTGLGS